MIRWILYSPLLAFLSFLNRLGRICCVRTVARLRWTCWFVCRLLGWLLRLTACQTCCSSVSKLQKLALQYRVVRERCLCCPLGCAPQTRLSIADHWLLCGSSGGLQVIFVMTASARPRLSTALTLANRWLCIASSLQSATRKSSCLCTAGIHYYSICLVDDSFNNPCKQLHHHSCIIRANWPA